MARSSTSGQGRPKGALNHAPADVRERLAAMGCDPIVGMARIALDKEAPKELRARMFAELAQYVAPKRRAVEHSGDALGVEALLAALDARK